ncbi:MAG: leucine-rich repeat protein [Muribaculaceae bacterium]|nr:leucine-rich repeat protein [Muribaculaceae bacterium]
MKKKLLLLLFIIATFGTLHAATDYGIEVNGTKITSSKLSFSIGSGMVTYFPSQNYLLVKNVSINRTGSGDAGIKVVASSNRADDDFQLYLEGSNTIRSQNGPAIVISQSKTSIIVQNGSSYILSNGTGYNALQVLLCNVYLQGEGKVQLASTNGTTISGDSYYSSNLTLSTKDCQIGGYDDGGSSFSINTGQSRITYFNKVTVSPSGYSGSDKYYNYQTRVTLFRTGSTSKLPVDNVLQWSNTSSVQFKYPSGTYFNSSSHQLANSSTSLYDKDIIVSDEQIKSGYYAIGDFIYGTASYNGYTVAALMTYTDIFRRKSPSSVDVPGFVTINGSERPVWVNSTSLAGLINVSTVRYRFGVVGIEKNAMSGMISLTKVYLPSSLRSLGALAFNGAGSTSNYLTVCWATVNPDATSIASNSFSNISMGIKFYTSTTNWYYMLQNYSQLTSYGTIQGVDPLACSDVQIGNNYYVITKGFLSSADGEMSLIGSATGTTSVTLNSSNCSVTRGGKNYYCTCIADWAYANTGITSFYIEYPGVKTIEESAFTLCYDLKHLTIGEGVTAIGSQALNYNGLTSVNWNAINCADFSSSGLFYASSGKVVQINSFTFGNKVQHIPAYLLKNVHLLSSITIPSSVTSIGAYAFTDCTGLRTVNWNPESILNNFTSSTAPFAGLNINYFNFASGVQRISDYLCYGLSRLTSLTVPSTVTDIGKCAFANCSGLRDIYPKMMNPQYLTYGSGIFDGVDKEACKLTVPAGTLAKYKNTLPWQLFFNIVQDGAFPGDVNGDGLVTSVDVTALYNYLLNGDSSAIVNGDQDGDGIITSVDITIIYNLLLGN